MTAYAQQVSRQNGVLKPLALYLATASAWLSLIFAVNSLAVYAFDLPGLNGFLVGFGLQLDAGVAPESTMMWVVATIQAISYPLAIIIPLRSVGAYGHDQLVARAAGLGNVAAYIVSAAFFATFFIGLIDAIISFVRVENMLVALVGPDLGTNLGRATFRGMWVHVPLILLGCVIAAANRGPHFVWLATLVVIAELLIVISRFVFSYEQAFMGDLVRFWYAALFLFASAYTLIHEGHVRVDVFYAGMSERNKARTNILGSLFLGIPLCWVILARGMSNSSSSISSPLVNFEISQSGSGMFVKYLMAGFLLIFVLSMLFQFAAFVAEYLRRFEEGFEIDTDHHENL
ncbi:MAG TPA: hypothetical protein DHV03_04110 [Alphaproteobacteria bacterium]|nr:hypothetical protein [Paracoccaceae bacterium]RCL79826.1 MAG: hypothetical protein DBW67_04980 [SAR116 cluster bacterium]HCY47845.1 hypothetical protein [Alphaproteobacteria bacterium]